MKLFAADSWLKAPLDRDVIKRWTVGGPGATHSLALAQPRDPDRFEFLAFGDSGDSELTGPRLSPQDAVSRELVLDAALPDSPGAAQLVLHAGDVVYMTGEHRLYERNFRRPYAPFLTPGSTVDDLTFRVPFLLVPGNHDYYDVGGWAKWLARIPLLRTGVRAASERLFCFNLPEGGSNMGAAFMSAFIDPDADTAASPHPYELGVRTRLPNRYYRASYGSVDFFALDSNTLEAPPPGTDAGKVRSDAASHIEALEAREEALEKLLRRAQKAMNRWTSLARDVAAQDAEQQKLIAALDDRIAASLDRLIVALNAIDDPPEPVRETAQLVEIARARWNEAREEWDAARSGDAYQDALERLEEAGDEVSAAYHKVEEALGALPQSGAKAAVQEARDLLEHQLKQWDRRTTQTPPELEATARNLTEEILDVQRALALERRRARYMPDDYDRAQLDWLDRSLEESVAKRPGAWRVVFLHHPLYTTTGNHCEAPDVVGLRGNLQGLLHGREHLVLSGHAHAFEWFRSAVLSNAGIFVTGGGGQMALRGSLLAERRFGSRRDRYESLRANGVLECAMAGKGPAAADGEDGPLYHYLRIDVTPDALTVRPIGVRRLEADYRRETPIPAFHAPSLPPRRPPWIPRLLECVTITRDQPPVAVWR
ncbi:MAG TPA: metallophosphoesterase [Chthonomonadaceae bacterium]|nr:metallophosphoesterase [Chthonomonadaceae bacterium]